MADHRRVKDLDREVVNRWDTEGMTREADLEVEDGGEDGRVVSISFNFVCIFFYNPHAGDGSDIAAFENALHLARIWQSLNQWLSLDNFLGGKELECCMAAWTTDITRRMAFLSN